jgi:hypothetical protein
MKHPPYLFLALCCSCSGADGSLPAPDASPLGAAAVLEGGATAPEDVTLPVAPDASADRAQGVEASASAPDAGALDVGAADASPVCSPVTVTPQSSCPGTMIPTSAPFPQFYATIALAPDAGGDCRVDTGIYATPAPCQCRETFTCACFAAHFAEYADGIGSSCIMIGGAPYGVH